MKNTLNKELPEMSTELKELSPLEKTRNEIQAAVRGRPATEVPFYSYTAEQKATAHKVGELFQSEDLRTINKEYTFGAAPNLDAIGSHRKGGLWGVAGSIVAKLKRKLAAQLWSSIMRDYFAKELSFSASVVRYLNLVSTYTDARDTNNFMELVRKIDIDTGRAVNRADRFKEELAAEIRTVEARINSKFDVVNHRLATIESVAAGLESLVARAYEQNKSPSTQSQEQTINADPRYVLLENRFRGSKEVIADRVNWYADYLAKHSETAALEARVLDIGCGRGELLCALRDRKIKACGVDMDGAMLAEARDRNLDVTQADLFDYLRQQPDNSLSAATAIQVIEHLTASQNEALLKELRRVIVPGGFIMLETINPCSVIALSSNYFRDPTHVAPQHPDTTAFRASLIGFETVEVRMLSPVPEDFQAPPIVEMDYSDPDMTDLVSRINYNFTRLNNFLFGHQDYCLIARKR